MTGSVVTARTPEQTAWERIFVCKDENQTIFNTKASKNSPTMGKRTSKLDRRRMGQGYFIGWIENMHRRRRLCWSLCMAFTSRKVSPTVFTFKCQVSFLLDDMGVHVCQMSRQSVYFENNYQFRYVSWYPRSFLATSSRRSVWRHDCHFPGWQCCLPSRKNCKGLPIRSGYSNYDMAPQSPDLNPIENVWWELKKRIQAAKPATTDQLSIAIKNSWSEIPVELCNKLVQSMPKRIRAVIKARGGATQF